MSSQIHLENFVESTAALPAELVRLLATIKDLDERSHKLSERIDVNVEECLNRPTQANAANRKSGSESASEVAELRSMIEADQQMLIQFAEEKMALACQCYDLVDMHLMQIERDIDVFEGEIQAQDALEAVEAELPAYGVEPIRNSKRLKEADKPERIVKDTRRRDRDTPERSTRLGEDPAAAIKRQQQLQMEQLRLQHQQQQQQQMQQLQQQQLQQQIQMQQMHQQHAAQAMQQGTGPQGGYSSPYMASPTASGSFRRGGHFASSSFRGADDEFGLGGYQRDLPPHLSHSAPKPQLQGRALRDSDISPSLEGQRAEMFWPDDNLWYLVEINSVDMHTHQAKVIYTTGETEEIDLDEIVRDKALSLITTQQGLW